MKFEICPECGKKGYYLKRYPDPLQNYFTPPRMHCKFCDKISTDRFRKELGEALER